jgi:hypothetical protein
VAPGEEVDVTGLPAPLASGGYHVGMDPARLPADPAGGTWAFTSLRCDGDDQPAPIDPKTGLAAFSLADGDTRTCVVTVTWTPVMLQAAATPGTAAPGPLPRTGAEIARSVAIALLAVGIGFVMLAIDRRVRRRRGLRPS